MTKRGRDALNPRREEVRIEPDGFSVLVRGKLVFSVKWRDVTGIVAFKRDRFTIDEIMLAFRVRGEDDLFCVSEHADEYNALTAAFEERFPEYDKAWWVKVAIPAFERKWTVVWGGVPAVPYCNRCGYDLLHGSGNLVCPECGHKNDPGECSACGGRGYTRSYWLVLLGLAFAPASAFLLYSGSGLPEFLRSLLSFFLIAGGALLLVGIRECIGIRCRTCRGTGRV